MNDKLSTGCFSICPENTEEPNYEEKCKIYPFHNSPNSNEIITQSKSKTIITRSMLTISLIVFTDNLIS